MLNGYHSWSIFCTTNHLNIIYITLNIFGFFTTKISKWEIVLYYISSWYNQIHGDISMNKTEEFYYSWFSSLISLLRMAEVSNFPVNSLVFHIFSVFFGITADDYVCGRRRKNPLSCREIRNLCGGERSLVAPCHKVLFIFARWKWEYVGEDVHVNILQYFNTNIIYTHIDYELQYFYLKLWYNS